MLPIDFVTDFIFQHFERVKITKNGEHFLTRCPLCGDSKKSKSKRRFNLEYNSGKPFWNCFNCGESGNFYELYSRIKSISTDEAFEELQKRFFRYNALNIQNRLSQQQNKNKLEEENIHTFNNLLKFFIDEKDKPVSYQQKKYLDALIKFRKQRKISNEFKLYVAIDGEYKGRIIIPLFENEKMIYFQARSINKSPIKYKNPPLKKRNIILNRNRFDKNKYIVICEGILDAYSVGFQGTTILGKDIENSFIEELNSLTDKGIIIALDNDITGIKSTFNFIKSSAFTNKVKYFIYPFEKIVDINDLKTKKNIINIYDFIVENSFSKEKWYIFNKFRLMEEIHCEADNTRKRLYTDRR